MFFVSLGPQFYISGWSMPWISGEIFCHFWLFLAQLGSKFENFWIFKKVVFNSNFNIFLTLIKNLKMLYFQNLKNFGHFKSKIRKIWCLFKKFVWPSKFRWSWFHNRKMFSFKRAVQYIKFNLLEADIGFDSDLLVYHLVVFCWILLVLVLFQTLSTKIGDIMQLVGH